MPIINSCEHIENNCAIFAMCGFPVTSGAGGTACVRCVLINQLFPSYIRYEQLERAEEYYDEVMQGQ